MDLAKMIQKDAIELAKANMSYGEGAGTYRKHVKATISAHAKLFPDYDYMSMVENAYSAVDKTPYIKAAVRNDKTRRASKFLLKNTKSLLNGDPKKLTPVLAVGAGVWFIAKETGTDEVVKAYAKKQGDKVKMRYQEFRIDRKLKRARIDLDRSFGVSQD